MKHPKRQAEELLIDLHLGRIADDDRAWLEDELQRDPVLRVKSDRLGDRLRPLDHWAVAPPPEQLIERTLGRVALRSKTPGVAEDAAPAYRGSIRLPLRELLAAAACLALLVSALVPGIAFLRNRAHKTTCASHLGSIFQGTMLYQASFAGSLPYAGFQQGASWLPSADRPYLSNSRHVYLVAKHNFGPKPEDFVCPSGGNARAMRADALADHNDFLASANNSYDAQNLAGASPNLRPRTAIAYLGDANPLFTEGRFDESVDPVRANSHAHGGKGQMVLTLDGTVHWMTTPVYGPRHDNVWLAGDIRSYRGTEAPVSRDDAQLVPGYPVTDPDLHKYMRRR